jgi:bifunctional UDP-N-acetylglucosamine pyrophosphorylase/glucosamine-1-phosphate N-acetyltransferase
MSRSFVTIIMAGGQGKRMKSDLPKVLHTLGGKSLVQHVIDLAFKVGSERVILIIGHGRELIKSETRDLGVEWAVQEEQLGTADAVKSCRDLLIGYIGDVLILSGDVPLMSVGTVKHALQHHRDSEAAITVFTFKPEDPKGYGRIIRGTNCELQRIVEEKDTNEKEHFIKEVNAGIYFIKSEHLFPVLDEINNDNAAGEYYITDAVSILRKKGEHLAAFLVSDPVEVAGVNSREQLLHLEEELELRKSL